MNDRSYDGYSLSRKGNRDIANAARGWAEEAKRRLAVASSASEAWDAVYGGCMAFAPEWMEYEQDYADFAEECDMLRPRLTPDDVSRLQIPQVRFDGKKSWLGDIEVRWVGCPAVLHTVDPEAELPEIIADADGLLYR